MKFVALGDCEYNAVSTGGNAIFQLIKDAGKDRDGSEPLRKLG